MLNRFLLNKFFLLLVDVLAFYAILFLSIFIRHGEVFSQMFYDEIFLQFSLLLFLCLLVFYIFQLYDLSSLLDKMDLYQRIAYSFIVLVVLSVVYFYFQPFSEITPKTILIIFYVIYACFQFFFRSLIVWLVKLAPESILLIGNPQKINSILKEITRYYVNSKKIYVYTDTAENSSGSDTVNVEILDPPFSNLCSFLAKKKVEKIVLDSSFLGFSSIANFIFLNYHKIPAEIWEVNDYYEKIYKKILLDNLNKVWFLFNLNSVKLTLYKIFKRAFDLLIATLALLFLLMLFPFLALLVKLSSPGPVLFKNRRVGKNNQVFTLYKFRTMKVQENQLEIWASKNDQRITKIGKFLRESRLDELPQFINILKGDLSFVGPRPEQPSLAENLSKEIPFYNQRHLVTPGLTGWAQLNFPYVSSVEDTKIKLQYDLYYIKYRSILLDLRIVLKTAALMFLRKGR